MKPVRTALAEASRAIPDTVTPDARLLVTVECHHDRWIAEARRHGVVWTVQQRATRAEALDALRAALAVTGYAADGWPT